MGSIRNLFTSRTEGQRKQNIEFQTDLNSINKAHHHVKYRGVPMIKCPFDMVIYQMIISQVQPDLILEIGTNEGGSALYFSDLLQCIGHGRVHSIDLEQNIKHEQVLAATNIELFEGGWQNYDPSHCKDYRKILVIDDGSHVYEEVRSAFEKFHHLVPAGSYYIIEDGILDQLNIPKSKFKGGPVKAAREILESHPSFVPDHKWLDFFGKNATFNPLGYLKRV